MYDKIKVIKRIKKLESNLFVPFCHETDKELANLISALVKAWGDRTLTSIELDDRIATAAEKSPTKDENIISLRKAINLIKA